MKKNDALETIVGRIFEDYTPDTPVMTQQAVSPQAIKKQENETFKHLENAAKYAEYDCVTFGLENDDGSIVKVYVKAEDAEKFENALGEILGKIDDIEEALNELGNEFDIVDVEWPEDEDSYDVNSDPSLDGEVYDNEEEKEDTKKSKKDGEKVNKQIPDSDVTEGMKFLAKLSNDGIISEAISFAFTNNKVAKEVVFILSEFGIHLNSDMFLTLTKKVHLNAIKNLSDEEKTAIVQFAYKIRTISSNKAIPSSSDEHEDVKESYDFDSKFRSKIEHMIFNVLKYLILGKDEQDLSAFVKPQMYGDFVQIVKTSKFKQQAYRQSVRNFMFKANLLEEISNDFNVIFEADDTITDKKKSVQKDAINAKKTVSANPDATKATSKPVSKSSDTKVSGTEDVRKTSKDAKPVNVDKKHDVKKPAEKPSNVKSNDKYMTAVEKTNNKDFEENSTYKELAKKDKNIKLAVDILKWMGFTEEVLDNSSVKMELRHNVRSRIKRVMTTPEAKRVKMIWSYELDKAIDEAIAESQWTDTEDLVDDAIGDISDADLKRGSVITKKFDLPDSVDYKPWKFIKDKDTQTTVFDDGNLTITFNDDGIDKISKSIDDEKPAFVVKDTEETKWVFTKNEAGGLFVVKQGKTRKHFLTPLDIEHLLK